MKMGMSSPWTQSSSSSCSSSPWIKLSPHPYPPTLLPNIYHSRLLASLFRHDGHVYSLAARDGVLYSGSHSKNIRVWTHFDDAVVFKSGSGLVKAIAISTKYGRVFTGHLDSKFRVSTSKGKRIGTLPKLGDYFRSSLDPKGYVQVRRHRKVPRVSTLTLCPRHLQQGVRVVVLRVMGQDLQSLEDGRCLESIEAHDDAINSIVVGFGGLVRRELDSKNPRHVHITTLMTQENAVTVLAVGDEGLYAGSSDGLVNF